MIGVASFEQVAASFWQPDSAYLRLAPLTDDLVVDAERHLDVTLPPDLLRLLRLQHGGVIADSWDACPFHHQLSCSAVRGTTGSLSITETADRQASRRSSGST